MWLNAKWIFWVLLVICFGLLLAPILIREKYSGGLYADSESYRSLRFAEIFKQEGIIYYDNLSYGGRYFVGEQGWFALLSINPNFMARYLPFTLGILSFILFYLLVARINYNIKGLASLLLIISPTFLYMFSIAVKYSAALFFILLGFYLYFRKQKLFSYLAFILSGLFSVFSLLLVVLIFLYYSLKKTQFRKDFFVLFIGFLILFLMFYYKIFSLGLPDVFFNIGSFSFVSFLSFIIFGFGGKFGLGFFFLILAILGIYYYYREKYKFIFAYFLFGLFLFFSYYATFLLLYINFLLAFFAAAGFVYLYQKEWKSDVFGFLTLLVICCGVLFSTFVFYDSIDDFYPIDSYGDAIGFLRQQEPGVVFSDYTNGEIINYAGKQNFMDKKFAFAPNIWARLEDRDTLFKTRSINVTMEVINKYDIKYLFIDSSMKEKYFINEEDGLLFVLKYSPQAFERIFENEDVEVWRLTA